MLNRKKIIRPTARPLSKSVCKEIEDLEKKMEDFEKRKILCFLLNVDEGNLLVLKVKLIPFLRAFAKVFGNVENQNGFLFFF